MIKITLCMWLVRPWHKVTFLHKTKQTRWSDYSVKLRPKRMCCQRPRGNIQRVQLAIPASATSLHSFFGDALLGPGWIRSERRIGVIPTSHRHSFCEKKFLSREGARHKHQRICGRTEHISSSGLEASHNSLFMLHLDACVGVIKAGSIFSFFGSTFLKHSSSSLAWSAFQVGQEKTSSPYCLFTCIVHQSNESVTSVDCENNQSIYIYPSFGLLMCRLIGENTYPPSPNHNPKDRWLHETLLACWLLSTPAKYACLLPRVMIVKD